MLFWGGGGLIFGFGFVAQQESVATLSDDNGDKN